MSQTKSTIPQELREHGIAAVHPYPSCANEDSHIVGRFDALTAWETFPKLELQPPHAFVALVLDCDSTKGLDDTPGKPWWGGNPKPSPSWMVINERAKTPTRRAGGIHVVYALEIPVARHNAAHMLPLVSRAERKRTSGAEQNRTTERHVVKHQGPGGVRARFRQLPEVGWTSCCA